METLRGLSIFAALAVALVTTSVGVRADHIEPRSFTIRVLHLNIYGRREKSCVERFQEIAKRIIQAQPPYDIISLNEDWDITGDPNFSCGASALWRQLEKHPQFRNSDKIKHSMRHFPRTDEFHQASGGNSVLTPHPIVDHYSNRYVNSSEIPLSGFMLSRVEIRPGVALDVWTTHLEAGGDGCDQDCRWEQLTDFGMVAETLSGVPDEGRTSTNPVLIVGDFNIGGPLKASDKAPFAGNPGYENIVETLKSPRDLWLETHPKGAYWLDSGYTYDCRRNTLLKCDYRERIDYMFVPTHKAYGRPAYRITAKSVNLTRWTTPSGLDVSDHYGLDATLVLSKN